MAATKTFGYARVSARDQNEARQIEALRAQGIEARDIYIDKQSGKDFDRAGYNILRQILRDGDTLVIASIDRLGRNYAAILSEWQYLTQEIHAHVKVLDMPLLDTAQTPDNLDGTFVAALVLQVLSYVAEKERFHIRERQRQGIALAKSQGRRLGRPALKMPDNFAAVYAQWKSGAMTGVQAMARLQIKKTSFYKLVKQYEKDCSPP